MYSSPVRHSPPTLAGRAAVRLACVRHAASVQSEPGSNSSVKTFTNTRRRPISLRATPTKERSYELLSFLERLLLLGRSIAHQAPTQVTCARCQRSVPVLRHRATFRHRPGSARGSRALYEPPGEGQHRCAKIFRCRATTARRASRAPFRACRAGPGAPRRHGVRARDPRPRNRRRAPRAR